MDRLESSSPHRRILAYVDKGTPFTKSCNFSSKLLPNRGCTWCTIGLGESRGCTLSSFTELKTCMFHVMLYTARYICVLWHHRVKLPHLGDSEILELLLVTIPMQQGAFDVWHAASELHVEKSLYQLGNRAKTWRSLRASLEQSYEWFRIGSTNPCQWAVHLSKVQPLCYASWFHFSRLQEHITFLCRLWIFDGQMFTKRQPSAVKQNDSAELGTNTRPGQDPGESFD